jgi:protein TonB
MAATPFKAEVGNNDIVELVEVAAPGYKGQRYWLTFDRATHLHAHLVKGTGVEEASEEQTLVALGEIAAPVPAAPAPVAVAVATPTPAPAPAPKIETPAAPTPAAPTQAPPLAPVHDIPAPVAVAVAPGTPAAPTTRRKIGHAAAIEDGVKPMPTADPAPVVVDKPVPAVVVEKPVVAKTDAPRTITPAALRGLLTSSAQIPLPDTVTSQMARDSKKTATAMVKVCIGMGGDVTTAALIKTSGYTMFDDQAVATIRGWKYKAYVVDGHAAPACSATVVSVSVK